MLSNLIFLDGPHGSGKTTLGKQIKITNSDVMIPEPYSRNIKFKTDPAYRQILKISSRAIENFECLELAKKNPNRIILANRGVYSVFVYNSVYFRKGWIDEVTYERYNAYAFDFFRNENKNPYSIVLNPGFKVVKKHLEKRWKEKGKKWREDDLEYAQFACEEYEKLKYNELVCYIDHEIDLESGIDVRDCNEWIEKVSGIKQREVLV